MVETSEQRSVSPYSRQTSLSTNPSPPAPPAIQVPHERASFNEDPTALSPLSSHLDILDLELLHHWTTSGCFSFPETALKRQLWAVGVPKEAMKFEFFMHSLLALSAVNMMHIYPERYLVYEKSARKHRNMALSQSIPHLNNITAENCSALWIMSTFVAVLAFAFPHSVSAGLPQTPLDDAIDYLVLLRGAKHVGRLAVNWLMKGPFAELTLFDLGAISETLPEDMTISFDNLVETNKIATGDPRDQQIFDLAIYDLRKFFRIFPDFGSKISLLTGWPMTTGNHYITAVKRHDPMALCILAHYLVLFAMFDVRTWWSIWRVSQIIEEIQKTLPLEWRPFVQWPIHAVQEIGERSGHTVNPDRVNQASMAMGYFEVIPAAREGDGRDLHREIFGDRCPERQNSADVELAEIREGLERICADRMDTAVGRLELDFSVPWSDMP